jgi:hypothetical protein
MSKQSKRVIGIAITISVIFFILAARGFYEMRQQARIASCMNDIRMVHNAFDVYAEQSGGLLPPISATRGNLMMDPEGFYPEYLSNSCWLQCEWGDVRRRGSDKNQDLGREGFNDDSFVYIPWEIRSEAEAMAFIEAYKTLDLKERDKDLKVTIDGAERVLPRTRYIPWDKAKSEETAPVPVFIEWPDHYHKNAVVVLSDGTAVRREFSEPFPISDAFIAGLREIAALDQPGPAQ